MHPLLTWLILFITLAVGSLPKNNQVKHLFERGIRFRQNLHERRLGDIPLLSRLEGKSSEISNRKLKDADEVSSVNPTNVLSHLALAEVPVETEAGHADACNDESIPCLCVDDGCGWDSDLNKCVNGSVTTCHECFTLRDDCIAGVCEDFGCPTIYNNSLVCQCTAQCMLYGNCCKDVTTSATCLHLQSNNIAKIAEDNALSITIGALALLFVVGVVFTIWYSSKSTQSDQDEAEQLPEPRRLPTNKFMHKLTDERSGNYSRIVSTPGDGHLRSLRSPGDGFANYADPLLMPGDSDRTPLMRGSGSTHEHAYESTRSHGDSHLNYHGRSLRFNPSMESIAGRVTSSMMSNPASCDLAADDFVPNSWEKIGSGNYGDVFSAKWFGATVAVKKGRGGNKSRDDMLGEASQLRDLSHPSLCEFIGVVLLPRELWIVTKFYQKGSVDKILKCDVITMKRKFKWCRQACGGLAFLHSQKLVHRDLACRNLLISKDDDCVIADFGLSRLLSNSEDRRKTKTSFGPVRWMALESLVQIYSTASDMWMFGVLVWEMLNDGKQPYEKLKNKEVVKKVQQGLRLPLDDGWPPSLNAILRKCWKKEPKQRPKATDFLQLFEEITGYSASPRYRESF